MARPSRPPGFDMTYRPSGAVSFGPPLRERIPALIYLAFAVAVGAGILYGQAAPTGSRIFHYVVEGDSQRLIPASACGIVLFASALAAVIRSQMRGVVVHPDGIEMRELLPLGWPRVRRLHWSQIDRLVVPPPKPASTVGVLSISLELWDGSRAWLPKVANATGLAVMLEKVALARAIPVEGGTGLIDDLGNPPDEGEDDD
jgi:hypothetical protein